MCQHVLSYNNLGRRFVMSMQVPCDVAKSYMVTVVTNSFTYNHNNQLTYPHYK